MDLIKYYDDNNDDDNSKEMIFLINETGEDLFISHSNNLEVNLIYLFLINLKDVHSKVDQNKSLVSSSLIAHKCMSLIVANSHRLQEKSSNIDDRCVQEQKQIHFQVITKKGCFSLWSYDFIFRFEMLLKRSTSTNDANVFFSINLSSKINLPIQILSDIQVRNDHMHVIFSSIGRIVNYTKMPLLVLKTNANDPKLYE
jgi:hypothetical protein